jgi:LPS sulfotransferase NodH
MTDPAAIAAHCRRLDVQLVLMHRRNLVKAAVSQMRAEQYAEKTKKETGQARWGVKPGSEGLGPSEIDPDVLLQRIEIMVESTGALFDVFGREAHLSVAYEEILEDAHRVIDRVCTALGVELAPIELAFQKATSSSLPEDVTNFADVEARLKPTRFHDQLLEP